MSFFKKSVFIGIGIFVPLIVCCVILELIFGAWLFEDKWRQTREINIIRNVKIDYDVKNIYGNKMPVVHYSRDKNGLRGGCKDPSNIDILTLGGGQQLTSDILETEVLIKMSFKSFCLNIVIKMFVFQMPGLMVTALMGI